MRTLSKPLVDVLEKDEAFGDWLAGFIDGEGCFSIHRSPRPYGVYFYCRFTIILRGDDAPLLEECQRRLGGKIYHSGARGNTNPKVRWEIVSRAECRRLADLLACHPLRSKKARDLGIWLEALVETERTPGQNRSKEMEPYFERLRAIRRFAA